MRRWQYFGVLALSACAPLPEPPPELPYSLTDFYAAAEARIREQGGMRTDYNPIDAPFTQADLAQDFIRIALFDEYQTIDGNYVAIEAPANLRRFERQVLVSVVNGDSTDTQSSLENTRLVQEYTKLLAEVSGANLRFANEGERANMVVFFLNRAEQPIFARQLSRYVGAPPIEVEQAFGNSPNSLLCGAFSLSPKRTPDQYRSAIILIKSEHSKAMRSACVQEEMAQALGLKNDSREARPSIFNDDEEFANLTRHDELLLKILYDPRLRAGMGITEVQPLLSTIIADIW